MFFYLDGYNLLFSLSESKQSLFGQRQKLIQYLQKQFAHHNLHGILVFDGSHRRDEESGLSYHAPLEIAFAPKGESADSYIIERVEREKNPKIITVVTNDRGLRMHARTLGAKVQGNDAFVHFLEKKALKKKKTKKHRVVETEKNISRLLKIFEEKLEENLDDFQ